MPSCQASVLLLVHLVNELGRKLRLGDAKRKAQDDRWELGQATRCGSHTECRRVQEFPLEDLLKNRKRIIQQRSIQVKLVLVFVLVFRAKARSPHHRVAARVRSRRLIAKY